MKKWLVCLEIPKNKPNKHNKFQFAQRGMQQEQWEEWEVKALLASKKSKDLIKKTIKIKTNLPWV